MLEDCEPVPPWLPELLPGLVPLFCVCAPAVPSDVEEPELEPEGDDDAPWLESEITAKSIFPDEGLRMMSSMRPIVLPEVSLTWAFMRLLPRTACCELRPVALSWLLLQLLDCPLSEPEMLDPES